MLDDAVTSLVPRVLAATIGSLGLAGLPLGAGAAHASGGDGSTQTRVLSAPAHGQQAIRRLGGRLDAVAARSGWSGSQLRSVLSTDDTAWVGTDGQVFYTEPTATGDAGPGVAPDVPPYPLDQTFLLHSKPGSNRSSHG